MEKYTNQLYPRAFIKKSNTERIKKQQQKIITTSDRIARGKLEFLACRGKYSMPAE